MNSDESAPAEHEAKLEHVDGELELDFIREFSTGGELLKGLCEDNRREHIRVAIYTQKLPQMVAHCHANIWNAADPARSLGIGEY